MTGKYDDIIDLPRPASKHPKMSRIDRAAQFSPFAAHTGHEGSIKETACLTEEQIDLDESQKDEIGRLLSYLAESIQEKPEIVIRWFQPDRRKSGGVYQRARDRVVKIDDYRNEMTLEDGRIIPLRYIVELTLP